MDRKLTCSDIYFRENTDSLLGMLGKETSNIFTRCLVLSSFPSRARYFLDVLDSSDDLEISAQD